MIKKVNRACEKLNDTLGISVTLPNPGRKALKTVMICNFIVGAGLLVTGIVFSSKGCAVLGGIEVISGAVLRKESKN